MATLWSRLKAGLARTRAQFTSRLGGILRGRELSEDVLEELEEALITADVGVEATTEIIEMLEEHPDRSSRDGEWAIQAVKDHIGQILGGGKGEAIELSATPTVILVVGVNGVGKTTTIGKLAARFADEGKRVLIGAADTFRAAADAQLDVWAQRAKADIVRQPKGSDAASVAYDAAVAGENRGADAVIIDTAGRLHTKSNLMAELVKIKRVLKKVNPDYPHETLLVLDATTGQNALAQARQFHNALGITGLAFTKLDSSAKGGMMIAVARELNIPVKLVGVGESLEDLQDFDPDAFLEALFAEES